MFLEKNKKITKLEQEMQYLTQTIKEMQKQISREFTAIYARVNEIENYINEQVDEVIFPN